MGDQLCKCWGAVHWHLHYGGIGIQRDRRIGELGQNLVRPFSRVFQFEVPSRVAGRVQHKLRDVIENEPLTGGADPGSGKGLSLLIGDRPDDFLTGVERA